MGKAKEKGQLRKQRNGAGYEVDDENLAVPEIHTGKVRDEEPADAAEAENERGTGEAAGGPADSGKNKKYDEVRIRYDTLAVPEVHIRKKH